MNGRKMIAGNTSQPVSLHRTRTHAVLLLLVVLTGCQSEHDDATGSTLPITDAIQVTDDYQRAQNPKPVVTPISPDQANTAMQGTSTADATPGNPPAIDPTLNIANNTPMVTPGVKNPVMYPADKVNLPEEAMIIGIVVNGQPRAFLQDAMSAISQHVVNAVVDTTPFSVTFCDRTDCVRVFSSTTQTEAIDLQTGGYANEEMLIMLDGQMYPHSSGTIPLQDVDFVRTAWIAWKVEHPETTVFLGSDAAKYVTDPSESSAPSI